MEEIASALVEAYKVSLLSNVFARKDSSAIVKGRNGI